MIELLVTENRSNDAKWFHNTVVRIFIDRDYSYGFWINEDVLYNLLTPEQQKQYLEDQSYSGGQFDVTFEVAQELIDKGNTPFNKQKLWRK
jgi:hypothetical protein